MKKIIYSGVCLFALCFAGAQTEDRKWNVGAHAGYTQYSGDLGQGFYDYNQAAYGFAGLSASRYLTNRFDASLMLTKGEAGYLAPRDYSVDNSVPFNFRTSLSTANLFVRYNLRSREMLLVPYVFAGGGVINQKPVNARAKVTNITWSAPSGGAGLNLNINETMTIQFQEMFTYTGSDNVDHRVNNFNDMYLLHTLGLTFNLGKIQRVEGQRAGARIDKCYEMGTGFNKRYNEQKKMKLKSKPKKSSYRYK